jgi:hypothetical protein
MTTVFCIQCGDPIKLLFNIGAEQAMPQAARGKNCGAPARTFIGGHPGLKLKGCSNCGKFNLDDAAFCFDCGKVV